MHAWLSDNLRLLLSWGSIIYNSEYTRKPFLGWTLPGPAGGSQCSHRLPS